MKVNRKKNKELRRKRPIYPDHDIYGAIMVQGSHGRRSDGAMVHCFFGKRSDRYWSWVNRFKEKNRIKKMADLNK